MWGCFKMAPTDDLPVGHHQTEVRVKACQKIVAIRTIESLRAMNLDIKFLSRENQG